MHHQSAKQLGRHGFCGTTADFCGEGCQSNCGTPSVPAGGNSQNVTSKVIAYYESWSDRRSCHDFPPTAIPYDALTHVNFAFAYIDPETYTIKTMDSQTPAKLFQEVADIKTKALSDLEVFIAIGGWTFSDNGTVTQPLLGEIAASEESRQKFADNLVRFMDTYGFDGVDIDWYESSSTLKRMHLILYIGNIREPLIEVEKRETRRTLSSYSKL